LAFFWKETAYIAGAERSVALLILAFFLATVDCTSSVAFVPYMASFREVYLSPYFVGEGLSGLLPSLVALSQGVGEGASDERCAAPQPMNSSNSTNSTSQSWGPGPRFSTEVFFWFLTGMMVVCGLAFLGLNVLPVTQKQKVRNTSLNLSASDVYELQDIDNGQNSCKHYVDNPVIGQSTGTNIFLLVVLAIINGLSNGIIPAIQSYACIPYSYYIYLLTLTLSNIANPLTCLIFPLMRIKSVPILTMLSIVYGVMCTYILVIASQSPNVLLKCHDAGAVLIVSIYIVFLTISFKYESIP
jgi:riboflavin transporter 2